MSELGILLSPATGSADADKRVQADLARLRDVADRITGSVFFGTMLATMRESSMKGRYGHGGRGEEVFAAQLDGILAERAGQAANRGLAEQLYRRLANQQALLSAKRTVNGEVDSTAESPEPGL